MRVRVGRAGGVVGVVGGSSSGNWCVADVSTALNTGRPPEELDDADSLEAAAIFIGNDMPCPFSRA